MNTSDLRLFTYSLYDRLFVLGCLVSYVSLSERHLVTFRPGVIVFLTGYKTGQSNFPANFSNLEGPLS